LSFIATVISASLIFTATDILGSLSFAATDLFIIWEICTIEKKYYKTKYRALKD